MRQKNIDGENSNLHSIQRALTPFFREYFMTNQDHAWLLADMNNLNGNFIDVIDTVCGYRIELGQSL
jgi:hypothetical protein